MDALISLTMSQAAFVAQKQFKDTDKNKRIAQQQERHITQKARHFHDGPFVLLVEMQGVEPWSRQGNLSAFYMFSLGLVFV
ncbi:hypothetical protein TH61_03495 [Rufibacter sp. DG15C]|nr:hypothetical protein TH61_03495 [Rufibacter sp. DG15C]